MGTHFATIEGIHFTHGFLDKGVAGFALHRFTSILLHQLYSVPGKPRVMHDNFTRMPTQHLDAEQANHVIAFDETPIMVEQKTAIEIAIPGNTDIGSMLRDRIDRRFSTFEQHRVGNAVRKSAVGLMLNFNKFERQNGLEEIDDRTSTAIARINHYF